jgi:N-acetylglucosaminyldiphosphoundecaprenol N-acetyl-beta-D-mannosaminyltransferase
MKLCNVNISILDKKQIFNNDSDGFMHLIPLNAEAFVFANNNNEFMRILDLNYTTIDGQIPLWLFKFKNPSVKIEKISGSDIVYDICNWASEMDKRVFLLGGDEKSNFLSVKYLSDMYPNLQISGCSPSYESYPFSSENQLYIKKKVSYFVPNILFVAFGLRKQHFWIEDNRDLLLKLGINLVVGCGGTLDFVSKKIKRAPLIIQKIGLESLWRLFCEPKLFRLERIFYSFNIFRYYY